MTGSGMAFPWEVIRDTPLAGSDLVEDLKLGLTLALRGDLPRFCAQAVVTSDLPTRSQAAATQRRRWEHGYMRTLLHDTPQLWWAGIRRCSPSLAALGMELCVPPLSLLVMVWAVVSMMALGGYAVGWASVWPMVALACGGVMIMTTALLSWVCFGCREIPASALLMAPRYALSKLPMYLGFLNHRETKWVRTERGIEAGRAAAQKQSAQQEKTNAMR